MLVIFVIIKYIIFNFFHLFYIILNFVVNNSLIILQTYQLVSMDISGDH